LLLKNKCYIRDMKKYILGIVAIIITLLGINQYSGDGIGADSVTPIAGQTYTLAGSGVSSSDTSITLSSFTITQTGYEILDADMSETFYLTLEPGSRSRQEIVSCTTVTQNANDTATLSGCERGLSPISPYSSSTDYAFAHSGGSTVIFSNPPQLYAQAAFKDNDETITGSWLFPTPLGDYNAATKSYVDGIVTAGTISNDRLIVAGTAGETLATGTLVYFKGSDQEWYKVDTDDTTTFQDKFIGLTQGSGVNAGAVTGGILLKGRHTLSTGLTAGGTYYASTSAGTFSVATSAQPIGVADDTNILYFDPVLIDIPRLGYNNTWTGTNTFTGRVTGILQVDTYTSSSTYTKQTGLQRVFVQAWGAGGSGSATETNASEAGGGGGGGYIEAWFDADDLATSTTITIGSGGVAVTDENDGNVGGNTTFGSLLTAYGGGGGGSSSSGGGGGGGGCLLSAGGSATTGVGGSAGLPSALCVGGGNGASTATATSTIYGGGGGAGIESTGAGGTGGVTVYGGAGGGGAATNGSGSGGTSTFGGAGGAGLAAASGNATSGSVPGGGGGAKWSNAGTGNSGAGGNGMVIVTSFY